MLQIILNRTVTPVTSEIRSGKLRNMPLPGARHILGMPIMSKPFTLLLLKFKTAASGDNFPIKKDEFNLNLFHSSHVPHFLHSFLFALEQCRRQIKYFQSLFSSQMSNALCLLIAATQNQTENLIKFPLLINAYNEAIIFSFFQFNFLFVYSFIHLTESHHSPYTACFNKNVPHVMWVLSTN